MKPEEKNKSALVRREMEIKRLIRQMELDKLQNSTVFKNLERELNVIKHELLMDEGSHPQN
jgi:hypothetical protein